MSSKVSHEPLSSGSYPENRIRITAETVVNPTEDSAKVEKALRAVLRDCAIEKIELGKETLLLRASAQGLSCLAPLRAMLRQDGIRDAARAVLFSGADGKIIRFGLNKQVAYVDHASFIEPNEETPLGLIVVEISCDTPESVIDWIAPRSR